MITDENLITRSFANFYDFLSSIIARISIVLFSLKDVSRIRLDREMEKPISLISRLIKKILQTLSLKTHSHFPSSFPVPDRENTKRKLKLQFKKFVANQFDIKRKRERNERGAFSCLNIFAQTVSV